MSENLELFNNTELKAYIKANRNNEEACHEALKILMSRLSPDTPKYHYNLPQQEMESLFREKIKSQSTSPNNK